MSAQPAFNELELSFLELTRTRNITANDVKALKNLWARYFMMKATEEADKIWKEKNYTNETVEKWVKGSD